MPSLVTDRPASPKVNAGAGISQGLVLFDTFDPVRTGTALDRKRQAASGIYTKRGIETTSAGQAVAYEAGTWVFPRFGYTFAVLGNWSGGTYILEALSGSDEATFYISGVNAMWYTFHGGLSVNLTVGDVVNVPAMVVATWDGATSTVYYNGRRATSSANTGTFDAASSSVLSLHANTSGASGLTGYTRMVGVWDRPLTATEVAQLYDDPFLPTRQPTRRFWSIGGATQALAGTIGATSSISGTLSLTTALSGTIAGQSSLSGSLGMTYGLAGTIGATSSLSGALRMTYALSGTIGATSSISGSLSLNGAVTDDPNKLTLTIRETGKTLTIRERA